MDEAIPFLKIPANDRRRQIAWGSCCMISEFVMAAPGSAPSISMLNERRLRAFFSGSAAANANFDSKFNRQ